MSTRLWVPHLWPLSKTLKPSINTMTTYMATNKSSIATKRCIKGGVLIKILNFPTKTLDQGKQRGKARIK